MSLLNIYKPIVVKSIFDGYLLTICHKLKPLYDEKFGYDKYITCHMLSTVILPKLNEILFNAKDNVERSICVYSQYIIIYERASITCVILQTTPPILALTYQYEFYSILFQMLQENVLATALLDKKLCNLFPVQLLKNKDYFDTLTIPFVPPSTLGNKCTGYYLIGTSALGNYLNKDLSYIVGDQIYVHDTSNLAYDVAKKDSRCKFLLGNTIFRKTTLMSKENKRINVYFTHIGYGETITKSGYEHNGMMMMPWYFNVFCIIYDLINMYNDDTNIDEYSDTFNLPLKRILTKFKVKHSECFASYNRVNKKCNSTIFRRSPKEIKNYSQNTIYSLQVCLSKLISLKQNNEWYNTLNIKPTKTLNAFTKTLHDVNNYGMFEVS